MPSAKNARADLSKAEIPPAQLLLIRICFAAALGISIFLAWNSLQGGGVPGCGPESGCDRVLSSRWAYIFSLPVSVFAAPIYLALLVLVRARESRWSLVMPLACLVLVSGLWWIGLQAFVLRSFCKFCMTAHAAGITASLFLLANSRLAVPHIIKSAGIATAALAVAALAQVFGPERGPKQMVAAGVTVPVSNSVPAVPTPQIPVNPTFSVIDGAFTFDLTRVPVAGPLNAPKKLAKLFDYTCHHCRDLHHLLTEFRAKHSNELAVVSLPMPLDSNCNPVVKITAAAHQNACEYAKLGLAVFHANPPKFETFTDWIYTPARPPELSEARAYAATLVGADQLEAALKNPEVAGQIARDIQIYVEAYKRSRSGQLPQMYFEHSASIGAVETRGQLEKIMAENLGFAPSTP